jgi:hypothetical protein
MAAKSFKKGEKLYDRVIWAFKTNYPDTFEFLITKSGIDLSLPISFPQGVNVENISSNCVQGSLGEITVPDNFSTLINGVLKTESGDANCRNELGLELLEWVGLAALSSPRLSPSDRVDPYICMPILQEIDSKIAAVETSECSGILSAPFVALTLSNLQYGLFINLQSTIRG